MTRRRADRADAWLTIPNVVTVVRLLLVLPIVLLIVEDADPVLMVVLLAVFAASDWVDGLLARLLGQTSRLGAVLDPVADRLAAARRSTPPKRTPRPATSTSPSSPTRPPPTCSARCPTT